MHVHTTIPSLPVSLLSNLEVTSVQVFVFGPRTFCSVYLLPTLDQSTLYSSLCSLTDQLALPFLILMDANEHQ